MNSITKKIYVLLTITILIGSASVAVVSAKKFSLFSTNDKPKLNELVDKWNEIRTKKLKRILNEDRNRKTSNRKINTIREW